MATEYTLTLGSEDFSKLANLLQLICVAGIGFDAVGSAVPTAEDLAPLWQNIVQAQISRATGDKASEVEYLRFFADKVVPCLGPADGDIIQSIKEEFVKKTGKQLPRGYGLDE